MAKIKIIFVIVVGFALTVLTSTYLSKSKINPSVSHAAVKVVLNQTPDYRLSLKSLSGESSYTSDYKLKIPFGYYNVKIIGDRGEELFSGKVEKNRVNFPPYEIDGAKESDSSVATLEPLKEMTLLLPYFKNGKKIIFFDENNLEKYQVDIEKIGLPEGFSKNLCGNGICDSGENVIFCYNDCHKK